MKSMPTVNQDFPLSAERRKEKLKEIKKDSDSISTVKVPGYGPLPVYRIPLQFLSYNPYNTRFLSQAKTWQKRLGRKLSNEKPEDVQKIEEFLWEYKKDKNENTIKSLIKEGQLQPGVVTLDGLILAGNRRFRLLQEITRHPETYGTHTGLQVFEAAIIDRVLLDKEIVQYESFYQYGAEDKVDYDPIQKYIAAKEQNDFGFSLSEIAANFAALTNGNEKTVQLWLNVYELMAEYLDYIEEPEIYTALTGNEESFLNLLDTITSLKRGRTKNVSWDYSDFDIDDLKLRYFDYIRMGLPTHRFRIFKEVFLTKNRWESFNASVEETVNRASEEIPSLDEYRSSHPDETEETISAIRRNDYEEKTKNQLNQLYGAENAFIVSKAEEATPYKIAQQAYQKLEKLAMLLENGAGMITDTDELLEKVRSIQKITGKIKMKLD